MSFRREGDIGLRSNAAVALAGFMGVGKTSVGKAAASALGRPFFDSDVVASERLGASITSLFNSGQEPRFRSCEAEVVAELIELSPPPVVALGGGALGNERTHELLLDQAVLVHLHLPWEQLEPVLPRLRRGRPLLAEASLEEIHALYDERQVVYSRCHVVVELRRQGVAAALDTLLGALATFGIAPPD